MRDTLQANGIGIKTEGRTGNDLGTEFRCDDGQIVQVYDTGKVSVQGKNQEAVRQILGVAQPLSVVAAPAAKPQANRNVFVVYGHDSDARNELEAMLRRWGLNALILDQLTSGGQTIIEKLESVRQEANFAVILATPDDQGHRANHPEELAYRARQNVVLELGMMLSVLGRDRVAILMKDQVAMERPSDIQGLIYIPFKEKISECALQLAKEIDAKGIPIDLKKV
ncbi:DNA-binding protein [Sphingorhabdus pulchriflava]|uniref:DNA-binding protein n=1 Tax=Sphingorhabdus pulchriflava TaxID=2292257 RepID=A0A371BEG2_9SPHN|nr:DNA-binding protein [Sphingorhabdus pulchriflava]